jgi:hypothetical protein
MDMRVFRSALAMALFIGTFGANAQEPPPPVRLVSGEEEDAYLLGMMGMGHVLILHDYIGMISESYSSGARSERAVGRLTLIEQHCGELADRIRQRGRVSRAGRDEFSLEQLVELLGLVREEARTLREMIESPSRNTRMRFTEARSKMTTRLQQFKTDSEQENARDEDEQ